MPIPPHSRFLLWLPIRRGFFGVLLSLAAVVCLAAVAARAADMRAGERVQISADETVPGNLYTAGSEVTIAGAVQGDLIAAGGRISIPGVVNSDITMMGGEIELSGKVDGDVRIAGGRITVGGEISGDLVVAGGTVRLLAGAVIGGEALLAGSELRLDGVIHRSLSAASNITQIDGTIKGPAHVRTGQLIFGERATLESELSYFAPQEADIPPTARIAGPIRFEVTAGMEQSWLYGLLRRLGVALFYLAFMMGLAGGLLGVLLFPKTSTALVQHINRNFGSEFLRGFVLFLVMPPLFFLLMVTVIGVPVAALSGMIHLGFGIVSVIYAAVLGGSLLLKFILKRPEPVANWKAVVVGIPALFLISLIPLFGFLINTVLFLAVFGGIYGRFWTLVRREQPAAPADIPE